MVLDSLASVMATGLGAVAAVFAGLWARQRYVFVKKTLERSKSDRDALDRAGQRLDAARKANARPVDEGGRTDFERRP